MIGEDLQMSPERGYTRSIKCIQKMDFNFNLMLTCSQT